VGPRTGVDVWRKKPPCLYWEPSPDSSVFQSVNMIAISTEKEEIKLAVEKFEPSGYKFGFW
jgi:hypothetical protein